MGRDPLQLSEPMSKRKNRAMRASRHQLREPGFKERAGKDERTGLYERAEYHERTDKKERAGRAERTELTERAGRLKRTVRGERADIRERTVIRERSGRARGGHAVGSPGFQQPDAAPARTENQQLGLFGTTENRGATELFSVDIAVESTTYTEKAGAGRARGENPIFLDLARCRRCAQERWHHHALWAKQIGADHNFEPEESA